MFKKAFCAICVAIPLRATTPPTTVTGNKIIIINHAEDETPLHIPSNFYLTDLVFPTRNVRITFTNRATGKQITFSEKLLTQDHIVDKQNRAKSERTPGVISHEALAGKEPCALTTGKHTICHVVEKTLLQSLIEKIKPTRTEIALPIVITERSTTEPTHETTTIRWIGPELTKCRLSRKEGPEGRSIIARCSTFEAEIMTHTDELAFEARGCCGDKHSITILFAEEPEPTPILLVQPPEHDEECRH